MSDSSMKNHKILTISIIFILNVGIISAKQAQIIHPLEITPIETLSKVDGTTDFVCQDVQWLNQSGEPRVPWKVITLLLPPDAVLETVEVVLRHARYENMTGIWDVSPQRPVALMKQDENKLIWPKGKRIVDGRDADIYTEDALWPGKDIRLVHVGQMRKWNLAQIAVPLIKYNPVGQNIKNLVSGEIELSFDRTAIAYEDVAVKKKFKDRLGKDTVRKIVANFEQQKEAYSQAEIQSMPSAMPQENIVLQGESEPAPGYVIITTSEIQSSSQELSNFVSHKQLKGFDVQVITEADFGGGVGDVAAENIRTWLQNHYVSDNIQYVLLVGNPHPTQGEIPMKMTYPRNNETELPEYKDSPTDFYYADLTGNWDLDGDGYYGEWGHDFGTGGVDRNWEVLVGRIPCYPEPNNPAEQGQVLYDSGPPEVSGWDGGSPSLTRFVSGYYGAGLEQRWAAQPFNIPDGTWNITQIKADYTDNDSSFDQLNYIIWLRNGQERPEPGDDLIQGTIAAPTAYDDPRLPQTDNYLHYIDVDFQLEGGDYYLTIYGSRADGQPGYLSWYWTTEDGIPLTNPENNPNPGVNAFVWRSAQFPAPGFQEYNLPESEIRALPGQDPNQLYTGCFTILGNDTNDPGGDPCQPPGPPAFDPNDLDHILAKIITYETTPQSQAEWRKNVLLPMKGDGGLCQFSYYLGEEIKETIIDKKSDWNCFRIYDEDYSLDPAPELTPCTKDNVTSTWANSPYGAVVWATHGWEIGASYVMDVDHAALLNDNYPSFTYQASCNTAHPETSINLAYSLLKNGGICTVGATRVAWGWWYMTSFDGTSAMDGLAARYSRNLILEELNAGLSLYNTKQGIVPFNSAFWMNYTDFNIYGCPAIAFSSYQPDGMIITPVNAFTPVGNAGGPFDPNSQIYTITNTSNQTIEYQVTKSQDWVSLNGAAVPVIGTLDPNDTTEITVQLNTEADNLPAGSYLDSIEFTNLTTGIGSTPRLAKFQPEIIYSGTMGMPYADCLAVDHLGNLYIAGSDAYAAESSRISKTNPNGIQIWEYAFQGYVNPEDIVCDYLGNVFIAGGFSGTVDLDPTSGEDWYSSGNRFIIKMNYDSTHGWSRLYNSTSMACDPFGDLILCADEYIAKMNENGDIDWSYNMPNITYTAVDLDSYGNIYLAGYFDGSADFDPTAGTDSRSSNGNTDMFITRLNADESYGWTHTIGEGGYERINDLIIDYHDNIFVVGEFDDHYEAVPYTVDFDPTEQVDFHLCTGGEDVFVTKYSSNGDYLWTKTIGGYYTNNGDIFNLSSEEASAITLDGEGNLIITGHYGGGWLVSPVPADLDPTHGTDWYTTRGRGDIFVTRLGPNGEYHWSGVMGGGDSDGGGDLAVDPKGNVFVAGQFGESADLDPTEAEDWHSVGTNIRSGFVTKISRAAAPLIIADADYDGDVDFTELTLLLSYWLDTTCDVPDWCDRIDFNHDNQVDLIDFSILAYHWLGGLE